MDRSDHLAALEFAPLSPQQRDWAIGGLTCVADAVRLERQLRHLAGVRAAVVNPATERVYLTFDPQVLDAASLPSLIERLGFHVTASAPSMPAATE